MFEFFNFFFKIKNELKKNDIRILKFFGYFIMLKEFIGYSAALITTFCLVPQLYKIIKDKNIEGVSVLTYGLLFTGQILWICYGILQGDSVIICANLVSGLLSFLIILFFNMYKNRNESNVLPNQQRTIVTFDN